MCGDYEKKEETSPTGKVKAHSIKENNDCCARCNSIDLFRHTAIILNDIP